jgi:hypothetical protein
MIKRIVFCLTGIAFMSGTYGQPLNFKNDPTFKKDSYSFLSLIDQRKLDNYDFILEAAL